MSITFQPILIRYKRIGLNKLLNILLKMTKISRILKSGMSGRKTQFFWHYTNKYSTNNITELKENLMVESNSKKTIRLDKLKCFS